VTPDLERSREGSGVRSERERESWKERERDLRELERVREGERELERVRELEREREGERGTPFHNYNFLVSLEPNSSRR